MNSDRRLVFFWKILIFLTMINYQVVVILMNDFIVLKFLRDLVLIYILLQTFARKPGIAKHYALAPLLILPFLVLALFQTQDFGEAFTNLRKYIFPLGVLLAARMADLEKKEYVTELLRFCLNLLCVLALWGIFQAHILKDTFLIKLGYPTIYSYAYRRVTLNYSYYFGNLGIQRVTATLSNSNVFGIILGAGILTAIMNRKELLSKPSHWLRLACIALGFLLTVSRSNFLAILLVGIALIWRYIPHKKKLFAAAGIGMVLFFGISLAQGSGGLAYKLINWVVESFSGTESSAAGRGGIWLDAWNKVIASPFGIGFGKTGASTNGGETYFCENSYLAMALDMGWLGCISYILMELLLIYDTYAIRINPEDRSQKKLAVSLLIYFMIICFFSNHIYDMEAISFVYFLVGITASRISQPNINERIEDTPCLERSNKS